MLKLILIMLAILSAATVVLNLVQVGNKKWISMALTLLAIHTMILIILGVVIGQSLSVSITHM
jgi:hypothetical protein